MTPESARSSPSGTDRTGSSESGSIDSNGVAGTPRSGRDGTARSREELEQSIEATREEIRQRTESLRRELALPRLRPIERIEEYPELAVGLALGGGLLAGRLLGRSRGKEVDGDAHRRLLARALEEARTRSEDGTLDEETIEEIASAYASALDRVAAQTDRGGGLVSRIVGELGPLVLRRLVREGADRIVPAILEAVRPKPPEEGA